MNPSEVVCYNCSKRMTACERYQWHDDFLGDFSLSCKPGEYFRCECGEEQLAYSLCLRIEQEEQERVVRAIMNMAHHRLVELEKLIVTPHELENILHVSRQAISKNAKLKTLVFHLTFKGKVYYLRESVLRFMKTGDGRFDLNRFLSEADAEIRPVKEDRPYFNQAVCCSPNGHDLIWTMYPLGMPNTFPYGNTDSELQERTAMVN